MRSEKLFKAGKALREPRALIQKRGHLLKGAKTDGLALPAQALEGAQRFREKASLFRVAMELEIFGTRHSKGETFKVLARTFGARFSRANVANPQGVVGRQGEDGYAIQ